MTTTPRAEATPPTTDKYEEKYENKTLDNTPSTNEFDWYLRILSYLKAGLNPAKICIQLGIPKQTLQYHLTKMKREGLIHKVGYGVWEVLPDPPKTSTNFHTSISHVGHRQHPPHLRTSPAVLTQANLTRFTQDAVRGHAFVFTLRVPKGLNNWNNRKREQYLTKKEIPFKHLNIGGEGQRIIVKDRKVWLTNPSIIIYDKSSYFAEKALEAKNTALATHLGIIKHIERLLHTSFLIGDDYKFKVSRQHYALIYNALASQYNNEGRKLEIRTEKGVWFLIDNSYNMNEAETVHPSSAMTDNRKVQDWFNGLKAQPITPEFVLEMMHGIQANQMAFAENIESHIGAIQDLGTGVRALNALIEESNTQ